MRTILVLLFLFCFSSISLLKAEFSDFFQAYSIGADFTCSAVNKNRVFLGCFDGGFLKSEDRGKTWIQCFNININQQFWRSIDVFDNTIISVGTNGVIAYSQDNGSSWLMTDSYTTNTFNSILLLDSRTGVAFGDSGSIYKTYDSGANWSKINFLNYEHITSAIKIENNILFLVTTSSNVYKSIDEGESWSFVEMPLKDFIPKNFSFTKDKILYLLSEKILFKSSDNGISWDSLLSPTENSEYCYYQEDGNGYIIEESSKISSIIKVKNDNEIEKVTYIRKFGEINLNTTIKGINFFDDNEGIIFGLSNLIYRTKNASATWKMESYLYGYREYAFGSICFINDSVGFIASQYQSLFKTTNYGLTWLPTGTGLNKTMNTNISDMHFFNENVGFLHTGSGFSEILAVSYDGFKTCKLDTVRELNGAYFRFTYLQDSIFFFKGSRSFYNADHTYIGFRDIKGEWSNLQVFDSLTLRGPYFKDKQNLFLCGSKMDSSLLPLKPDIYYRGVVLKSEDQGQSWKVSIFDSTVIISSIEAVNENIIYAFGKDQMYAPDSLTIVFKSVDGGVNWYRTNEKITKEYIKLKGSNNNYVFGNQFGQHVFSTDSGNSWQNISSNIRTSLGESSVTENYAYFIGRVSDTYPIIYCYKLRDGFVGVKDDDIETLVTPKSFFYPPYPHPISGYTNFDIVWDKRYNTEDLIVNIYNLFGTKVVSPTYEIISKTINTGILRWNSSGLPSGIYFVELEVGGYKKVQKVVVY